MATTADPLLTKSARPDSTVMLTRGDAASRAGSAAAEVVPAAASAAASAMTRTIRFGFRHH
jgi:hypothetical protein